MENKKKKCSFKEHKEIDAICFCQICNIYMCDKCTNYHKGLLENHPLYNLDENIKLIFSNCCKEKNHDKFQLKYFCKSHNLLCCAACISKIKGKGDGQHKDCSICLIEDIKEEKKNKLSENIKCLEDLSKNLDISINKIKKKFEKINENKEELKLIIQQKFTKIRDCLNKREDLLLILVDNKFNNIYAYENIIKESEKLPNRIKISLEKGKNINKEWNDENLNSSISVCLSIENNIKDINNINENIKKCNLIKNKKMKFYPEDNKINEFIEKIKNFGQIYSDNYRFRKCPLNLAKYKFSGKNQNILTKTGGNSWIGILGEDKLEQDNIYKWKIKIIKNSYNHIRVGIVPIDLDILSDDYSCGWCFYFWNSSLYSGPPLNYSGKKSNLGKVKNEIVLVANMIKGTLKFIIDKEDKGESFTDIPLDKPLVPAIFLYDNNDSVEIEEIK